MATSGAYKNQAFDFAYAVPKATDPTSFFDGTFQSGEVKYRQRNGSTLGSAVSLSPLPTPNAVGSFSVALTSAMMNADEILIEFIPTSSDFAKRIVSIVTEPTPSDVLEVQETAVTGVSDFKADVSGLATSASISALNDFNPTTDTVANVTTVASVSGSVGSISGVTFPAGFSSLTVSAISDGVWDEAQSGHTTVGTFGYYLDDQISGIAGGGGGTDWTATEKNQIRYRLGVDGTTAAPSVNSPDLATQASVDTVDANVDAILVDTGTTIPGTIATVDANVDAILVDTGTTLPAQISGVETKIDTVDVNVDAVLVDTGTTIPAQIAGLNDIAATDIVSNGAITTLAGAVVNVDLVDVTTTNSDMRGTDGAYTGTPATAGEVADAVWDESYSAHTAAGTFGKLMDIIRKANLSIDGTVSGTPTVNTFDTNLTDPTGAHDHQLLLFVSGSLAGYSMPIETYVQSNGQIVLQEDLPSAPSSSDEFVILPDHIHPVSEIQSGLATSAALAVVDSNVDSILADTSTEGVVISTAQAQAIADEVLKRSVATGEATAAEHSLATIILSILESSRSATVWTIKRSDGVTSHLTKTLTLDGTAQPVTGVSD